MLVAYSLGHSVLLLAAGVAPSTVQALVERVGGATFGRPIRIALALLLIVTGGLIAWTGLGEIGLTVA